METDPFASAPLASDKPQSGKRKTGVLFRISRTIPPLPIGHPEPYMVMLSTVGFIDGDGEDWGWGTARAIEASAVVVAITRHDRRGNIVGMVVRNPGPTLISKDRVRAGCWRI